MRSHMSPDIFGFGHVGIDDLAKLVGLVPGILGNAAVWRHRFAHLVIGRVAVCPLESQTVGVRRDVSFRVERVLFKSPVGIASRKQPGHPVVLVLNPFVRGLHGDHVSEQVVLVLDRLVSVRDMADAGQLVEPVVLLVFRGQSGLLRIDRPAMPVVFIDDGSAVGELFQKEVAPLVVFPDRLSSARIGLLGHLASFVEGPGRLLSRSRDLLGRIALCRRIFSRTVCRSGRTGPRRCRRRRRRSFRSVGTGRSVRLQSPGRCIDNPPSGRRSRCMWSACFPGRRKSPR